LILDISNIIAATVFTSAAVYIADEIATIIIHEDHETFSLFKKYNGCKAKTRRKREKRGQGPEREEDVNNESEGKRLESQYQWMKIHLHLHRQ
jgi:hypothetical protein